MPRNAAESTYASVKSATWMMRVRSEARSGMGEASKLLQGPARLYTENRARRPAGRWFEQSGNPREFSLTPLPALLLSTNATRPVFPFYQMNKKKLAPILLLGLFVSQSPSHAITGGPFDNNQVPGGGADGTYSAVLTGRNLIGMATFGIGSYTGFEGNGRFAVFHEGFVNYGAVSGNADLADKVVAAGLLGVAGLPGETTGGSANIGTGAGQALTSAPRRKGPSSPRSTATRSKSFSRARGALSSMANSAVVTTATTTNSTTIIILPANPQSNNQDPLLNSVTTTETTIPATTRTETPFKVRGSRTSLQSFTALNSFASLPPLVPSSPAASATASASAAP